MLSLQKDWDQLAKNMGSPLLSYAWFYSTACTIHKQDTLKIFIVRENSQITAIAPLYISDSGAFKNLSLLGASSLYEPANLLFRDQQSLAQLLDGILSYGLPLSLLRMPDNSLLTETMKKINGRRGLFINRPSIAANYIPLKVLNHFNKNDACVESALLEKLTSSRRYELRRKRNRLEKSGKVTIEWRKPDINELHDLFQDVLRIEDAGWKGQASSSLMKNTILKDFFYQYAQSACKDNILRICFIYVDGKAISMHLGIQAHQAFWVLKLGHIDEYNKCSPGMLTVRETILYSMRTKLHRYEFLGYEEKWQDMWPVEKRRCSTLLFFPYSLSGVEGLLKLLIQQIKERIYKCAPSSK